MTWGGGSADLQVVAEAREGAEGEVNSYLARRFRVPIDIALHSELASILADGCARHRGTSPARTASTDPVGDCGAI